ncbi:hypothetical protein [Chloracidobacterium aggregatum]|nr:hypothetical protein [Chloracidobacterium aggregatum]
MILQVTVKPNARQRRLKPLPGETCRACVARCQAKAMRLTG